MKKKICLIFFFALALGLLIPSSSAKAASKKAPNNVKSMKETYYDAVINLLTDGRLEELYYAAEQAERVPNNLIVSPAKFAVADIGEEYPILLVSGAKTKSKTWYLKPENTLETMHSFNYNAEKGSFYPSNLEFGIASFGRTEESEYCYSNLFLNSGKDRTFNMMYFTTVMQQPGRDADLMDLCIDISKYKNYTDAEKLVSKLLKNKECKEIKWFKSTDIKGFKKAYKGVVKKTYKDKRNSYYGDKSNPLSYLPYKITGGTLKINKYKNYTEYLFKGVNDEDYSCISKNAAKGAYIMLHDGASSTDTIHYYYLDGKKVSEIVVSSYIECDEKNWNMPADSYISVYKLNKLDSRGTIYYVLGIYDKERDDCDKMSDAEFIKYLKKNYAPWVEIQ